MLAAIQSSRPRSLDTCMRLGIEPSPHQRFGIVRTSSDLELNVCNDETFPSLHQTDQYATNICSASSESASPLSPRESTPEPPSSYAPKCTSQRESEKCSDSSFAESSPSRESTPELSRTPMRTRKSTRSYSNRRTSQKKTKSKKSSTSLPLRVNESSLSSLPPGASWDAAGKARCGLDDCTQKCHSIVDLRRHRESLAHCRLKQHACPGCPMRFTREDALKRHFNHRGAARCRDPDMTALRDEFLETEEAREAHSEGKSDRVVIALYNAFLGMNAGSSKKRRR
ncbi:hypothetical protein C8R45DRAFT_979604 [Mycena sanguinolenta]|nr:hypothetical protein C8R45DRAFT_979604 [Mycena sanguinolenta]